LSATSGKLHFQDALYGSVGLGDELMALVRTPTLQRLRHVRLSNIDSIDMPSIANLSRLEHVIGVAHLAGEVGFRGGMQPYDFLALRGAALLHDWAITSFGHLVEEALQYVGTRFDHEERLREIMTSAEPAEVGGVDMQILVGRETGLRSWANKVVGRQRSEQLLSDIMESIRGRGRWGRVIAGDIDLDNVDNVFRMAYHLGLGVDREVPIRIARAIVGITPERGELVFKADAEADIEAWRAARRDVYEHLMLAERDFIGKVMMLSAAVGAYEAGEFTQTDWLFVDYQFISLLLGSGVREVKETAERWIAGELWDCTPLRWMEGERPDYPALRAFSHAVGRELGRTCFAYAIKDKRERRLSITFDDGSRRAYGADANQWLLGIGSSRKEPFSLAQVEKAFSLASQTFGAKVKAPAHQTVGQETQACLF
jgi:HD superfamily phosphohydrolase